MTLDLTPIRPDAESLPINAGPYLPGNYSDQTATLNAIADEARATGRGLFIPDGIRVIIEGEVNLRGILNVEIQTQIHLGPAGLIIIGDSSRYKRGLMVDIRRVAYLNPDQTNVALRSIGVMQGIIRVGLCPRWEWVADRNDPDGGAISYTTVYPGQIDNLEFRCIDHHTDPDAGAAWITECLFIGGDIRHIKTESDSYRMNSMTFFKSCMEGGTINLDYAVKWRFLDCRFEFGTEIRFGPQTARCLVEDTFGGGLLGFEPSCKVIEDLGRDNVVRSAVDDAYTRHALWTLDTDSDVYEGTAGVEANGVAPGIGNLSVSAGTVVADTGLIPVRGRGESRDGGYATAWRMPRFVFSSDVAAWRPEWRFYGEDGRQLTSSDFTGMEALFESPMTWRTGGHVAPTTDVSFSMINVTQNVGYVRCTIKSGSSPAVFGRAQLLGFTLDPSSDYPATLIRRRMELALLSPFSPPMGAAAPGTVVATASGVRTVVEQRSTTVSAATVSGTVLPIASNYGIAVGDVLGVEMANGVTHWAIITGASSNSVTLSRPLPGEVAAGSQVIVTRWS